MVIQIRHFPKLFSSKNNFQLERNSSPKPFKSSKFDVKKLFGFKKKLHSIFHNLMNFLLEDPKIHLNPTFEVTLGIHVLDNFSTNSNKRCSKKRYKIEKIQCSILLRNTDHTLQAVLLNSKIELNLHRVKIACIYTNRNYGAKKYRSWMEFYVRVSLRNTIITRTYKYKCHHLLIQILTGGFLLNVHISDWTKKKVNSRIHLRCTDVVENGIQHPSTCVKRACMRTNKCFLVKKPFIFAPLLCE